jgi:zinc/manganese transport system ATP-binding protein
VAEPLVEFRDASFSYGAGLVAADVDLAIESGGMVGLVGPSGAGKTTLLRALLGQIRPVRGRVLVGGKEIGRRPEHRIGYVPQLETIDWHFPVTVREVVFLGLVSDSGVLPWPRPRDRREVQVLLDRLGIGSLADRHIRELSGGQQQRVFLARALIRHPDLLLLDEPTSGVDVRTRQEILGLLRSLNAQGIATVLTTHDLNSVAATLPDIVCFNQRVIARGSPEDVFTPEVLRATFGSEMVVFRHGELLLTADAPGHVDEHPHHGHLHDEHAGDDPEVSATGIAGRRR